MLPAILSPLETRLSEDGAATEGSRQFQDMQTSPLTFELLDPAVPGVSVS